MTMTMSASSSRVVKVAVIGSGLAGLTATYLLSRDHEAGERDTRFEVHLFEKADSLGMDSSSVSLPGPDDCKSEWRIDVPMRSFQGGYYPQLIALYKHLGVKFRQADFSYSFSLLSPPSDSRERRRIMTTMIYNGASGREGVSMPTIFSDRLSAVKDRPLFQRTITRLSSLALFALLTLQVIYNYIRLVFMSLPFLRAECTTHMTFREWSAYSTPKSFISRKLGLDMSWNNFTREVLIPLFSAVCTASEEDVLDHPMEEFLDYVWLTFGTHHYVVTDGVREVVSRLSSATKHIHLSSPITSVLADSSNPSLASISCATPSGPRTYHGFEHIVFATQANRAVPLLETYLSSLPSGSPQHRIIDEQIQCLASFRYLPTIVINHTDETLMPDNPRDWRDLNLVRYDGIEGLACDKQGNPSHCVSSTYTMATHALPLPPGYPKHRPRVYQTTNPIIPPKRDTIFSVAWLERAILTSRGKRALEELVVRGPRRWWECVCLGETSLGRLQGAGRSLEETGGPGIWFCGSYAQTGIPLLEGCVVSARNVVEKGIFPSEGIVVEVEKDTW